MLIVCGMISVAFCVVSWVMTAKKSVRAWWASICSLAFVSITLLAEYRIVLDWVHKEDWSALLDVVPSMFWVFTGYVMIMIFANAIPLFIIGKKHK